MDRSAMGFARWLAMTGLLVACGEDAAGMQSDLSPLAGAPVAPADPVAPVAPVTGVTPMPGAAAVTPPPGMPAAGTMALAADAGPMPVGADAGDMGAMPDAGMAAADTGSALPPVTDYSLPGPFETTMEPGSGPGGAHTIFRPEPLGEDGFLHSPIIWGPGIFTQVSSYTQLLSNLASHGFVVVAVNSLSAGPNAEANRAPMLEGLEWIVAQNDEPGVFQGKLDVKRAVSMGYSVGGTAAVEIGGHESVFTTVSIHGHVAEAALHGPMLQTSGTQDTVGLPMQQDTFDASQVQTFLATVTGASHTYILADGGGAERAAIVAWLRYWVNGDEGAKAYFFGDDCTLCQSPWENPQRKNWP